MRRSSNFTSGTRKTRIVSRPQNQKKAQKRVANRRYTSNSKKNVVKRTAIQPKPQKSLVLGKPRHRIRGQRGQTFKPVNSKAVDFFSSDLIKIIPETVYILATGPNGKPFYDKIPQDAFVIAVNQGIMIRPSSNIWMVFDYRASQKDWWNTAMTYNVPRLFSRSVITRYPCEYTFIASPSVSVADSMLIPKILRGGATIAGCAVQAAYYGGAKEIILCGIDMSGDTYYDGSLNKNIHFRGDGQKVWVNTQAFSGLLQSIKNKGTSIKSLSPTFLDVEIMS